MNEEKVMQLFELCGHVLENRERLILANIIMNHRTPDELSKFVRIPKFLVVRIGKSALLKIRTEAERQLKEAHAPAELLEDAFKTIETKIR
jgi:DNA-directed RNA polymerase specialized sigma subunit